MTSNKFERYHDWQGMADKRADMAFLRLLVQGFLEGNGGTVFTVPGLASELGMEVGACRRLLQRCAGVEWLGGRPTRCRSTVPPLVPTEDGLLAESQLRADPIGFEAREDFYQLGARRGKHPYPIVVQKF